MVVMVVMMAAAVAETARQRLADNHSRHKARAAVIVRAAIPVAAIGNNHGRLRLRIDDLRLRLAIDDLLLLMLILRLKLRLPGLQLLLLLLLARISILRLSRLSWLPRLRVPLMRLCKARRGINGRLGGINGRLGGRYVRDM